MKVIWILTILWLIIGCQHESSNIYEEYDQLIWQAMLEKEDSNFENSLQLFDKAFKIVPDDNETLYLNAASIALTLGKSEKAKDLIIKAIRETNPNKEYLDSFGGFSAYKTNPIFKEIEQEYTELVESYYNTQSYPKAVSIEVSELVAKDQEARSNGSIDMATVDYENISRLINLTNRYGWIDDAWLILWHQRATYKESNRVWNHFKPLINNEIKNGKIRKSFWAIFEDEQLIRESEEQLYGMYQNQVPIRNVEYVDERRWEVGLPPLWYMNQVYGHELPVGYQTEIVDLGTFIKWISKK